VCASHEGCCQVQKQQPTALPRPGSGGHDDTEANLASVKKQPPPTPQLPLTKSALVQSALAIRHGEITLEKCLRILVMKPEGIPERPSHLNGLQAPYALYMEVPKQKRTASKWGSAVDNAVNRADRWANSGGDWLA
jgi:hypothetical protein